MEKILTGRLLKKRIKFKHKKSLFIFKESTLGLILFDQEAIEKGKPKIL